MYSPVLNYLLRNRAVERAKDVPQGIEVAMFYRITPHGLGMLREAGYLVVNRGCYQSSASASRSLESYLYRRLSGPLREPNQDLPVRLLVVPVRVLAIRRAAFRTGVHCLELQVYGFPFGSEGALLLG